MPVKQHQRSEEALRLRESDPEAWNRLHPSVRDEATIYADIRASEIHNSREIRR